MPLWYRLCIPTTSYCQQRKTYQVNKHRDTTVASQHSISLAIAKYSQKGLQTPPTSIVVKVTDL